MSYCMFSHVLVIRMEAPLGCHVTRMTIAVVLMMAVHAVSTTSTTVANNTIITDVHSKSVSNSINDTLYDENESFTNTSVTEETDHVSVRRQDCLTAHKDEQVPDDGTQIYTLYDLSIDHCAYKK